MWWWGKGIITLYKILKSLENDSLTFNKLAMTTKIPRASLLEWVQYLENKGIIARVQDDNATVPYFYKKPIIHSLTPKGRKVLELIEQLIEEFDLKHMLQDFDPKKRINSSTF